MLNVLLKAAAATGSLYNDLVAFCAERIFYYTETPLFNNRVNQLLFNKYAEVLMWCGSIAVLVIFGVSQTLYAVGFFLPAIAANTVPPIGKAICRRFSARFLKPLKVLYDEPMHLKKLGSHKTWGGFIFGILAGTAVAWPLLNAVIKGLNLLFQESFAVYTDFALAFALSTAALTGDAIGSGVKRKKGVAPGEFVPMDLYGWSLAALIISLLSYEFWQTPAILTLTALTILPIGSSVVGLIGVILKIKESR